MQTNWAERLAFSMKAPFYNDPVGWIECYVDVELTEYQKDVLDTLAANRREAVRSPHGGGKTATVALALWWFSLTRDIARVDWKVITTASAFRHLQLYLWPEIHKWSKKVDWKKLNRKPPDKRTELLDMRLKLDYGAASAVASDLAVNIEGAHARSIFYIFDESKAIPEETWDAAEGALSTGVETGGEGRNKTEAFALAISTPGPPNGRFYDIHRRKPGFEDWAVKHITMEQCVEANRMSKSWVEARERQFGRNTAVFQNRVLGEFWTQDEDAIIPLDWIEAAQERWRQYREQKNDTEIVDQILSVDVARSGTDFTAIARRRRNVVAEVSRHRFGDTMATTAQVIGRAAGVAQVVVDSVGVGAGVVDRLKEIGAERRASWRVFAFTGSAGTKLRDRSGEFGFANVRSAAWWRLRELLDPAFGSELALPDDDQVTADLTTPKWSLTSGAPPRIAVEPKDKLTKRMGRSPDVGDSLAMAFWPDAMLGRVQVVAPWEIVPTRPQEVPDGSDGDRSALARHRATKTTTLSAARLRTTKSKVLSPLG